MIRCGAALRVLAAVAALWAGVAAGQGTGAELAEARAATERRDFAAALALYERLLQQRGNDDDLLIEAARVHGWADRHADAIGLYRRVLAVAPGRRADILPALAWQLLWGGDAGAARPLFAELAAAPGADRVDALDGLGQARQALGEHDGALQSFRQAHLLAPENLRVHRRLALALLWNGREAEAAAELEALQRRVPGDRDVAWALANARNFAGRHRDALRDFLRLPPPVAAGERVDLARAWRWAGHEDRAAPLLAGLGDADATWLRDWRVQRELSPFGTLATDHAEDRDALVARAVVVGAGWHPLPGATVEFKSRQLSLSDPSGRSDVREFQASVGWRFGEPTAPGGTWWPTVGLRTSRFPGWDAWLPQLRLRGIPADGWRVDAEAGREAIETPRAVAERVSVDVLALGVEHRPDASWQLAGSAALLRFDDGTRRVRVGGRAERRVVARPRLAAGVEAMAFERSSGAQSRDRGYWNPQRYAEARMYLSLTHEWQPFELQARVAVGRSREVDGGGSVGQGRPDLWELNLGWDVAPALRVRLAAGGSGAGAGIGGGGAGYWRRYANLSVDGWW